MRVNKEIMCRSVRNLKGLIYISLGMLIVSCSDKADSPIPEVREIQSSDVLRSQEDINGVWLVENDYSVLRTIDGELPPLLPEANTVYQANIAARQNGNVSFDRASWCASPGVPRLMLVPHPFEIMVGPRQVAFLYEWNRWMRLADMSGSELELYYPLSFGVTSGHFEADNTLVVETKGLMKETVMDSAGLPHSDDLVMTERFRLLSDDVLENHIKFEDPQTFSSPWETVVTYRRQVGAQIQEDVCLDNIKLGLPAI